MDKNSKILVAGSTGLVGSAIIRGLLAKGYQNIIATTHQKQFVKAHPFLKDKAVTIIPVDLTNQEQTKSFFEKHQPEYVFLAAAKVGGIGANTAYPAEFIYQNLMIAANVIHAAYIYRIKKLLNLGSSCIYPKNADQPITEEALLTGELEPTNEAYAIAKIAAIKLCRYYNQQYQTNFISIMPTNLYGPYDNFNPETSHVIPAMMYKFHQAKKENKSEVILWGTGRPKREFLYVDDLAQASIYLMENYNAADLGEIINIGTGKDLTIQELAQLIQEIVGFKGKIVWDATKPDGMNQKQLDISKITKLGWQAKVQLKEGLQKTYQWYLSSIF